MATDIWGQTLTPQQQRMMQDYTRQTGEQVTEEPASKQRFQSWVERFFPSAAASLERSMTDDITGSLSPITESNVSPFNALSNKVRDVVDGPYGDFFRNTTPEKSGLGQDVEDKLFQDLYGSPPFEQGPEIKVRPSGTMTRDTGMYGMPDAVKSSEQGAYPFVGPETPNPNYRKGLTVNRPNLPASVANSDLQGPFPETNEFKQNQLLQSLYDYRTDENTDPLNTLFPPDEKGQINRGLFEGTTDNVVTQTPPVTSTEPTPKPSPKLTTTPTTDTDTSSTPTATTQAPEGQDKGQGILAFLGRNPEIVGALGLGAQGIGQMLQGRAQDKANRRTRDEQAMNNAIAAFVGGPAERAVGETATSTGGGILSALGKAMGGYGDTRFETDEALLDRESAERIAKMQADANRYVAQMNARGRGSGDGDDDSDITDIQRAGNAYGVYWDALGRGEISGPLQGHLDKFPVLGQWLYPTDKATRNLGEATALTLAVAIQGSRPSEGDRIAMEILLPRIEDTIELREIKDKNIRALLAAGEALRAQGKELSDGWTTIVDPSDGSFDPQKLQTYVQPIAKKNPSGGTSTASAGGNDFSSVSPSKNISPIG